MCQLCFVVKATSVTLEVSEIAAEEGTSVTFTCITFSNPSPRLTLYRQREGQSTSVVKMVTGVKLSWTDSVKSEDNKAEFHCRVDDNKNIDGWNFDVQSEFQQITVWCKYKMEKESEPIRLSKCIKFPTHQAHLWNRVQLLFTCLGQQNYWHPVDLDPWGLPSPREFSKLDWYGSPGFGFRLVKASPLT